jgi:hypothetical protein
LKRLPVVPAAISVLEIDRGAKHELQHRTQRAQERCLLSQNKTPRMVTDMNAKLPSLPGISTPILSNELLTRLYELNFDYLELLIAEHTAPTLGGMRYLPERLLDALAETSIEARQVLAASTFSLYSLGFEDQQFWRRALSVTDQPIDARYGVPSAALVQTSFCEVALLHAWHVAVSHPIAARLLYGMSTGTADRMARVQLWQLKRAAADYPGLLMPRWPSNPCFWPDMLKFAMDGDLRRLDTIQQLGRQLLCMELQASAVKRSAARQRNLLQQRLRKGRG